MTSTENPRARTIVLVWTGIVGAIVLLVFPIATLWLLNWEDDPAVRWIHEIRIRKQRIAALTAGKPRLLIAGGSSGFFSVDAGLLTAKLGRPAVNLCTHGALGPRFLLEDARRVANPGDVILLYFEMAQYSSERVGMTELERKYRWTHEPRGILRLPWQEAVRQIYGNDWGTYSASWERWLALRRGTATAGHPAVWTGYSFAEMSGQGDFRGTAKTGTPIQPPKPRSRPEVDPGIAIRLQEFLAWSNRRGITVIVAIPARLRSEPTDRAQIRADGEAVREFFRGHNVAVLETSETWELPREFFYDTQYHTNAAGRRIVTEALVRELKSAWHAPVQRGEATTFLVASPDAQCQGGLAFASNDAVAYRHLAATDLGHPLSMTPTQVKQRAEAGERFLFADAPAAALLEKAGISSLVLERKMTSLADWQRLYGQHLFALATIGSPAFTTDFPEPFRAFGRAPALCQAALIGTGPFEKINRLASGPGAVTVQRERDEAWPQSEAFPLEIAIRAAPAFAENECSISVERQPVWAGREPGLAVAVIDPARGIIVRRGLFTEEGMVEYELRQVTEGAR